MHYNILLIFKLGNVILITIQILRHLQAFEFFKTELLLTQVNDCGFRYF